MQNNRDKKGYNRDNNQNYGQKEQKKENPQCYKNNEKYNNYLASKNYLFEIIKKEGFSSQESKVNFKVAEQLENFAKYLGCEYLRDMKEIGMKEKELNEVGLSNSSIRKIYDNYIILRRRYQNYIQSSEQETLESKKDEAFSKIKPQLILIRAKVNYLVNRKLKEYKGNDIKTNTSREAYESFKEFIDIATERMTKATTYQEFEAFIEVFEALVGFMKQ